MRTVFLYLYVVLYMIWTLFLKIELHFIKKRGNKKEIDDYVFKIVSNWSRNILRKIGTTVVVQGNDNLPKENCLFVSNHQGNLDFCVMLGYINKPMGFIAKKEILKIPVVSSWMKEIHCVFMDRENIRETVKAIDEGVCNLKNGYSMVIFPEGTRSKGHEMGEFKKGSMKLGIKAGVPIVPVTIDGTYKIFEDNDGKKIVPAEVKLIIGKPIYTKDISREDQKNLAEIIKSTIQDSLNKLS